MDASLPISKVVFFMAKQEAIESGSEEADITYAQGKTRINISDKTVNEDVLQQKYKAIFNRCLEDVNDAMRHVILDMVGITERDLKYINFSVSQSGEVNIMKIKKTPTGYDKRIAEMKVGTIEAIRKLSDKMVVNHNVTRH